MSEGKTAIVTGAGRGIGAGLVAAFLKEGYNVVATSLDVSQSLTASPSLVLVDGDIGKQETAVKAVEAAIGRFGTIDVLVNNAGILRTKPFTDFTTEDINALVSTNLLGFIYITQLAVKQMLKQKSGSVVSIPASLADQPITGLNASVSMMTKGGLNTVIRSLAIEYAKEGIRFNAVAPGVVDTPLHKEGRRAGKRHCRRCSLHGTGGSSDRRSAPRGWWCSRRLLVTTRTRFCSYTLRTLRTLEVAPTLGLMYARRAMADIFPHKDIGHGNAKWVGGNAMSMQECPQVKKLG